MAFLTNSGSISTMPYPSTESYLQLAHPSLTDILLLQQLDESASGYKPPSYTGLLKTSGRSATASLILSSANTYKLEWLDLAFIANPSQVDLLELLAMTQTGALPCTVVDNMLKTMVTRQVTVQLDGQYKSFYGGLNTLLVQFSLLEV